MRILLLAGLFFYSGFTLSQIQHFTLNNGLKIIVKEDHRAPIAVSMIWYHVGSADEPGGITGVSHVLEHMLYKGTVENPIGIFSQKITQLGGEFNAMTHYDYTAYYEKLTADQLATSFALEADRMQNLQWEQEQFKQEMNVIQEERRIRINNVPQALALEHFLATAHVSAPYHHPVIGWMPDLKQMTMQDAKTWYEQYYSPNNATLVVVGDVKPSQVFALAKQYFAPLKSHIQPVRKQQIEPPGLGKKTLELHTHSQVPLVMLGYTVPSLKSMQNSEAVKPYALEIIAAILGAANGRLIQNLEQGSRLAHETTVQYNPYAYYQTQFIVYGIPSSIQQMGSLTKALYREIDRIKKEPIGAKELEQIKVQLIAQKTFEQDSIYNQAMEIGLLETIGLGYSVASHYAERIHAITAKQIQQIAQRYFIDANLTEAIMTPKGS